MSPKGVYVRTPENTRKPRSYPPEIVDLACSMYEAGMTVAEIREVFPRGYRVQTLLERYLPARRPAVKRDQRGPQNASWRGDDLGYSAAHLRVYEARGSASSHICVDCGNQAKDWSYVGNCPRERRDPETGCAYSPDVARYEARCRVCHRAYDLALREEAV